MISVPKKPPRIKTSFGLDRVLGGGVVLGSTLLVGGRPENGTAVLAMQIAGAFLKRRKRVVWVVDKKSASRAKKLAARILGEASEGIGFASFPEAKDLAYDRNVLVVLGDRGKTWQRWAQYFASVASVTGATAVMLAGPPEPYSLSLYLVDVMLLVRPQKYASVGFKNLSCARNRYGNDGMNMNMRLTAKGFSDWPSDSR